MVFDATFNNISVISWRSVLSMDETGVHRENHRPVTVKSYRKQTDRQTDDGSCAIAKIHITFYWGIIGGTK